VSKDTVELPATSIPLSLRLCERSAEGKVAAARSRTTPWSHQGHGLRATQRKQRHAEARRGIGPNRECL
jgi:hypothetical protein